MHTTTHIREAELSNNGTGAGGGVMGVMPESLIGRNAQKVSSL